MKSKKVKLVTSLLSVGALTAILVPTITLTSCSATANPYIPEFVCKDNSSGRTFTAKFSNGNQLTSAEIKDSSGELFDATSFTKKWDEIKKSEAGKDLPSSIWNVTGPINNADVKKIVTNQNYLTLFISVMNNLRNIYENYNSLFISKNPMISNLVKTNKFVNFMAQGLNESASYARLWLSNIEFSMSVSLPANIGQDTPEETWKNDKGFKATISGIKLKYEWYELGDDGSTRIDKWDNLQKYKAKFDAENSKYNMTLDESTDMSFVFNAPSIDLYFTNQYNNKVEKVDGKDVSKHYLVGLISPGTNKPLSFSWFSGDDEQKRRKTDFFNKEVLAYIKNKFVTEKDLNELYRKVGFLQSNNFPNENNDNIPLGDEATNQANIKAGKNAINTLIGWNLNNAN